jgi:AcrR family transcriptional regulator
VARRSDHTRLEIRELAISKSIKLISAKGALGFNARSIAREMGYTVGTIYYEFGSLLELRYHVCGRILDIFLHELHEELKDSRPDLQRTMLTYVRLSQSHSHLWSFLFTFQAGPRENAPEWYREKLELVFRQIEVALAPHVSGKKQVRESARIIWSSIHGMCVLSLSGKLQMVGADAPEVMAKHFLKTYLAGLTGK